MCVFDLPSSIRIETSSYPSLSVTRSPMRLRGLLSECGPHSQSTWHVELFHSSQASSQLPAGDWPGLGVHRSPLTAAGQAGLGPAARKWRMCGESSYWSCSPDREVLLVSEQPWLQQAGCG